MKAWTPERVAQAAGATLLAHALHREWTRPGDDRLADGRPRHAVRGSPRRQRRWGRVRRPGAGRRCLGRSHPPRARRRRPPRVGRRAARRRESTRRHSRRLATAWRRELSATVIGVTGSTGKTSTKDLLRAILAPHRRTVASRANFNTEIGLPLEILRAPMGTEVLVLEMAMRGTGQIAELAEIAEPDIGVIVSVGPVHLELLGTRGSGGRRQGGADRRACRPAPPRSYRPERACSILTCAVI